MRGLRPFIAILALVAVLPAGPPVQASSSAEAIAAFGTNLCDELGRIHAAKGVDIALGIRDKVRALKASSEGLTPEQIAQQTDASQYLEMLPMMERNLEQQLEAMRGWHAERRSFITKADIDFATETLKSLQEKRDSLSLHDILDLTTRYSICFKTEVRTKESPTDPLAVLYRSHMNAFMSHLESAVPALMTEEISIEDLNTAYVEGLHIQQVPQFGRVYRFDGNYNESGAAAWNHDAGHFAVDLRNFGITPEQLAWIRARYRAYTPLQRKVIEILYFSATHEYKIPRYPGLAGRLGLLSDLGLQRVTLNRLRLGYYGKVDGAHNVTLGLLNTLCADMIRSLRDYRPPGP